MNELYWPGMFTTYEEFVIVTDAPQSNRMKMTGQDTDNKGIVFEKQKNMKN